MFLRFNLILTFILLVSANPLMAQNTLEDSVEYMTSNLLEHPKSKGLLLNKSISFFDVGSHTIKNNGSFCSVDSLDFFVRAISEMGKKSTSFPLQWAKQLRNYYYNETATSIPLVTMLLEVDKMRLNSFSEQKLVLNQQKIQLTNQWEDAMDKDTLLWAGPLVPSIHHPTHTTFRLDSLHWVSNGLQVTNWRWRRLYSHEWSSLTLGIDVSFSSVAGKLDTLELEISCDSRVKIVRFTVSRTWNQVPNENVHQTMIQATTPYRTSNAIIGHQLQWMHSGGVSFQVMVPIYQQAPVLNKALVSIDYVDQSTNPVLQKPFIIVEGIDFGYEQRPNGCFYGRCGSLGYFEFINARKRDYNPANPDELLPEFNLARTFKDSLRRAGYDVVFVDFEKGADFIQDNAMVLVEVLRQLRQTMTGNDGMVVCGASMGGLVARYALTWMEHQGEAHCVRDFISFDSPQEGANAPLSIQKFTDYTARHNPKNIFHKSVDARDRKFNSPASRQMMLTNYEMPVGQPHALRTQFLQELQTLGNYPTKLRKIALSNGNLAGTPLPISAGANLLSLNINPSDWVNIAMTVTSNPLTGILSQTFAGYFFDYEAELYALCGQNGLIFKGDAFLPTNQELVYANSNCKSYDNLAGGVSFHDIKDPYPWLNLMQIHHPNFCLIPTASALGKVPTGLNLVLSPVSFAPGNGIPFDAYWSATINERHVQISYSMMDFVLARLRESSQHSFIQLANNQVTSLNLGKQTVSVINTSLQVPSGKTLTFNNGPTKLGDGTWVNPTPGEHLTFEIGGCKPVECRILPGGKIILGNNQWNNSGILSSTLKVKSGSTLWIEGILRLEGNSVLVIEDGATLKLSQGNAIELANSNCKLELHGKLLLESQAVFNPKGLGSIDLGQVIVDANPQSRFEIIGTTTNKINVLVLPSVNFILPSTLEASVIQNTNVVFSENSSIEINSPSIINQSYLKASSFNGPQHGIVRLSLDESHQISFSKFEYMEVGLEATGNSGGNLLEPLNCEFINCYNGISLTGSGLNLVGCTFKRNNQALLTRALTNNARIKDCIFEFNVGGAYLEAQSGVRYEVSKSRFSNQQTYGIQFEHGTGNVFNSMFEQSGITALTLNDCRLWMTCSQLIRNSTAVELDNGSVLDISESSGNVFRNNSSVFVLYFSDPSNPDQLIWKNGRNDLRWNSQLISGLFTDIGISHLSGGIQSVNSQIGPMHYYSIASQDNLFNAPHPTTHSQFYWTVFAQYFSSSGVVYDMFVDPQAQLSTPFSCRGNKFEGQDATSSLFTAFSSTGNRQVQLSNGQTVNYISSLGKAIDSIGVGSIASLKNGLLNLIELLSIPLSNLNQEEEEATLIAARYMAQAKQELIQLSGSPINDTSLSSGYQNALTHWITNQPENQDEAQFMKGSGFRMEGDYQRAEQSFSTLNNSSVYPAQYWTCVCQAEALRAVDSISIADLRKAIEGCKQWLPARSTRVASTFTGWNNAIDFTSSEPQTIKVYPQPVSNGMLYVQLSNVFSEEEVDIELIDATGKRVRQWTDRQGGNWALEVSGLASGIYQLRVLTEKEELPPQKVVIHNGL